MMKCTYFQTSRVLYSKQLFHGCLVNSQNYCPEVMRMTMVDYGPRSKAEGYSPSGHPSLRRAMVLTIHHVILSMLFVHLSIPKLITLEVL